MEKHSSCFQLAILAFLLLTFSGPALGNNKLRVRSDDLDADDIISANAMKNAIMKEVAKEKLLIAAYNNYKQQMMPSSRKLGLKEVAMGNPLECLSGGTPCILFGTPCCSSCFPGPVGVCLP